jgi:hypothetical protein
MPEIFNSSTSESVLSDEDLLTTPFLECSWDTVVKDLPKISHPFVVELWYAIASTCKATYWTRTWIFQETILARTLLLFFGSTKVLSSTFFKWCDTIKQAVVRDMNLRFDDAKMQADLLESSRAIPRSTAYYLLFTKAKLGTNMTPKLRLCELLASY